MTTGRLKLLNTLLRDYLGTTPAGGPLYKWVHSTDRELRCHVGRLESDSPRAQYEEVPQVWEPRWVLAMWQHPPSEFAWEMQFNGELAYPRAGYYLAVDTPCDPLLEVGVEPNERITNYIIGLRKKEIAMGPRGLRQSFENATAYRQKEKERLTDDFLADKWTAFGQVPGVKGSASFGGI